MFGVSGFSGMSPKYPSSTLALRLDKPPPGLADDHDGKEDYLSFGLGFGVWGLGFRV